MPMLDKLDPSQNKKFLVYGLSGAGKTVFAHSFPGPIYSYDFDGKISSAANFLKSTAPAKLTEIEFDDYRQDHSKPQDNPFIRFYQHLVGLERDVNQGKFRYKTLVLDSLTKLSEIMMFEVMRQNPGSGRSKIDTTQVPNLKDYQIAISHFKNIINRIIALPCNVVFTAHVSTDKDELTGEINRQPLLWGKDLPAYMPVVCEEVYYVYAEEKDSKTAYFAQLRPNIRYKIARTQLSGAPNVIKLDYKTLEAYF